MAKKQKPKNQILHKFFYKGNTYFIDTKRLELIKKEYDFNISSKNFESKALDFLKKNKLTVKRFLEKISICWIQA